MLQQEPLVYNPTPFATTTTTGEREAVLTPTSSAPGSVAPGYPVSPSARQRMSQQQLLRHSMGGRTSYVAGMRRSTAHTAHPDFMANESGRQLGPALSQDAARGGTEVEAVVSPAAVAPGYTSPQDAALTAMGEDFVHEVLAMNSMAMEQCYAALGSITASASAATATEEPMKLLREAFLRLDEASAQDLPGPLLDQLKATTLNNMGVVECNRGQPRQALSHFEAARQLEENNDMASPSVALNTCAAYNALRMYDKATAAALEAIDMLRALEAQRQRSRRIAAAVAHQHATSSSAGAAEAELSETLLLEAAGAPQIAESQNAALWGAAWNNLAIAQINTSRESASKDTSEYTNTLTLFQNAMRATQDLLGAQHPMSKAVVETFRSVRLALRTHGAFKQHRTLLRAPLPPVDPREQAWEEEQVEAQPGQTRHNALVKHRQQLTITFRGEVTGGQKLVERVDATPYPGAAAEAYQSRSRRGAPANSARSTSNTGKRSKGKRAASTGRGKNNTALRGMPHSETLARASVVYGNPHPLLYTPPPADDGQRGVGESAPPSLPASGRHTPTPPPAGQQGSPARRPPQASRRAGQPASGRAASTTRSSAVLLPSLAKGRRSNASQLGDDDEMNKTTGTTASSVFMHHPPPAPQEEAAVSRLQHAKMLLLAAAPAAGAADRPTLSAAAVNRPADSANSRGHLTPSPTGADEDAAAAAADAAASQHELFQGMWVTADSHYVHRGPRVFGRPVYYTIATTLDVDEEGVASTAPAAEAQERATPPRAALEEAVPSPGQVGGHAGLPILTYSDSSSDEEAEGPAE